MRINTEYMKKPSKTKGSNSIPHRVFHGCGYSHGVTVMGVMGTGVVLDSAALCWTINLCP